MSGYPNPQDIVELRACLLALQTEKAAVTKAAGDRFTAEKRLSEATERVNSYNKKVDDLLESMDVASPDNDGYKNRLLTLLTGLSER